MDEPTGDMRATNFLLFLIAVLLAAVLAVLIHGDWGTRAGVRDWRGEPPAAGRETSASERDAGPTMARLAASVAELRASVDRLSERVGEQRGEAESRAEAGGGERMVADRRPSPRHEASDQERRLRGAPDATRRMGLDDLAGEESKDVQRRFWMLTLDDLVERYGPPDEIVPKEGGRVLLEYDTAKAEFYFFFYDGRLLRVDWDVK